MTTYKKTLKLSFLLSFFLLIIGSAPAFSQGILVGVVTDAERDETLIGVNILVAGTSQGTASGLDGSYSIRNLRAGEYSIKVSYIGYETKLYTGIVIQDGRRTTLDIDLKEAVLSTNEEIVIIGEKPLVDVEQSSSAVTIGAEQLDVAPVSDIQSVVAAQAGVVADPTGLYIRGGRANETGYIVDGVSAKDPLAGTGFGLDIGSNAFSEVEVTTGGVGAEHGDVTSGIVSVKTQDGGNDFKGSFAHKRDNFGGVNEDWGSNFKEDTYEYNLGGRILKDRLFFFTSGQVQLADGFTRETSTPNQLRTSLFSGTSLLPRASNRWSALGKITWIPGAGMKLQASYQRSLTVNQNTRMLQVTGNDASITPGFQYSFIEQPDNANTFAHDNNIAYLKWAHVLNTQSFYEVQVSRLFTRLRSDANGRKWRPDVIDSELDPESIIDFPGNLFVGPNGEIPDPNTLFILPASGFFNNGGIATRWHDHYAEELTLRATYTRFSEDKNFRINAGFEMKRNDYQWIDIIRPWVGAPIVTASGDTTATNRLGQSSDIWQVEPSRGGFFATGQIRFNGLIANIGARLEYWAPGKYVDDLVENPDAPILDAIREGYRDESIKILGKRYKFRLLPKLRVSFPIRENQVLFFNYGHSTQLPHPTFVYTGLDPFFQDRSFFADLGNPNLNPEVDISYEIGLRNQITNDDVLSVTAFWRDKFDFITVENILIPDATGRETSRAFRVNGDFARIRGLEASYLKRIGKWFQGQISGSFSRATGLSSTNNDALSQFLANGDIDNTVEAPLAWDRPIDLKTSVTLSWDEEKPLWGVPGLNKVKFFISSTFRSGRRYTPVNYVGNAPNPITGEPDWRPIYERESDPTLRLSEVGEPWWWFDMSFQKAIPVGKTNVRLTLEITNLFNQKNSVIINPVTGEAYPILADGTDFTKLRGNSDYDVTSGTRDPRYEDPTTSGLPPFNPARYLPQRHIVFGLSYRF